MGKAIKIQKENKVMTELLKEHGVDIKQFKQNDVVEGVVVSASTKEILLDIGAKSEGIISGVELGEDTEYYKNLKPGDTVLATVVQAENEQGYVVLSLKRAEKDRRWTDIENALKNSSTLEAIVLEYNKGGLLVDCLGLRGFVPLSHLDRGHFANDLARFAAGSEAELKTSLTVLHGTTLKVKVIEADRSKNRLVLSEKDAVSSLTEKDKKTKLSKIKIGDDMDGIVTGVMPFGIFVDLDGVEGLVHISEIAWEKVSHPGNYYKVGAPITVKVIGSEDETGKLALSVKQLTANPWERVEEKYPVGTKIKGKVTKVVPFGAFVNLERGLDGLVHVSETVGPLEEGDKVEAMVTQVSKENQKLALSIRQAQSA